MNLSKGTGTFTSQFNSQLERFFEQGPGASPLKRRINKVIAAIVPSSPYELSGVCSAWAYKEIGETPVPATYIILGSVNSNTLSDKSFVSTQDFTTPVGTVKNDRNMIEKILDNNLVINEIAHQEAHSIDVQLPFLQFINSNPVVGFRIIPILTSTLDLTKINQMAERLYKLKNVIYIASADLFSYGQLYRYRFRTNQEQQLATLRIMLLEKMTNLNTKEFVEIVKKYDIPFAGAAPIALLLEVLRLKKTSKGKVLCNKKSSETDESFVEFASIIYNES